LDIARREYRIRAYLSSSNIKTWPPYRFVGNSFQITSTRLIWGLWN
jgi:hypothetical protein